MQGTDSGDVPSERAAVVRFQSDLYSVEVIKKAAYRLSDRAVCDLRTEGSEFVCTLRFLSPQTQAQAARLADDFALEVLDQDLRRSVAAETAALRNAILAYAFSRADITRE